MFHIWQSLILYLFYLPIIAAFEYFYINKIKKTTPTPQHIAGVFIFSFILLLIINITGVVDISGVMNFSGTKHTFTLNLLPHFEEYGRKDIILNCLLFIPVGIFIPLFFGNFRKCHKTMFVGFIFSLLIELSQLFSHRTKDIDDLFMNTLGTLIGYGIFYLLFNERISFLENCESKVTFKYELPCLFALIICFYFLLHPLFENMLFMIV